MSENTSDELNMRSLKHISSKHFIENLEKAPQILKAKQANQFFKVLLSHFSREDLPQNIGNAILQSIMNSVCSEEIVKIFISAGFAGFLPYQHTEYHDLIFNILYVLVSGFPALIDSSIANNIPIMFK